MAKAEEYAIIKDGSQQYLVAKGDVIDIDLRKAEPGQTITFDNVMLVRRKDDVQIGRPVIAGAKVTAEVTGKTAGDKVFAYTYKRRKGQHRKVGHRQKYTRVSITDIVIKEAGQV